MLKKLAILFLFLLMSLKAEAATYYAVNAGGNWNAGATWSTISAKDVTRVGGATVPTASDTCILDDYSGNVTVNASTCVCGSLDSVSNGNYAGVLTFTASQTLTLSGNATFSTAMSMAGTGSLAFNNTATITSNGKTIPGAVSLGGTSKTYTMADNLTVTGNLILGGTTLVTLAMGTNNLNVTGTVSIQNSATLTGSNVINVGGLAVAGSFGSKTVTLPTDVNISGTFSLSNSSGSSAVFVGARTFSCGTLSAGGGTGVNATFAAGSIINVSSALTLTGAKGMSVALGIVSSVASSPIYLNYTGIPANSYVTYFRFQDVDASGSAQAIYNYNASTLTRVVNIYPVTQANLGGVFIQ